MTHLRLQLSHGMLLLRQLPAVLLLPGLLTSLLSLPHLGPHLLLKRSHLTECSLVLLAALLVLAHLRLESMHRLLLLRELLVVLPLLLSLTGLLTSLLGCLHLACHLPLQGRHLLKCSLVLLAAL